MRTGLRLRILVLLGALLVLAFVPLFATVATYTRVTLQDLREEHARSLGRAVASHVSEARSRRSQDELAALLGAQVGAEGVQALDPVWEPLDALAPAAKEMLVEALVDAVSSDQRVSVAEAELLRTVCAVLHCPLPALLERG